MRKFLAVALSLLVSQSAFAASQVILTQQNRQGTFVSASMEVPAVTEQTCIVELMISQADMSDPTTVVEARMFVSADGGSTWQMAGGGKWVGGPDDSKNGAVRQWRQLFDNPARYSGMIARVELDVATTVRIGIRLTL